MESSDWKITVRDFRCLKNVDWSPEGVCLLAGPNGAGKTTLLNAILLLCRWFLSGHQEALRFTQSAYLRHLDAADSDPVIFEIRVGDITWSLALPVDARGLTASYGETLKYGDETILRAEMYKDQWVFDGKSRPFDPGRCCAKWVWDREEPEWMRPLVDRLRKVRIYFSYWLNQVKTPGLSGESDSYLNHSGANLWTVLRNWKSSPRKYRDQFAWVINAMRAAFPGQIVDIEFDGPPAQPHGKIIYSSDSAIEKSVPAFLAADGFLTGLLQLTAVAGAPEGYLVAFDEMENRLHPHAIRSIISSMREIAEERDMTIILSSHSPVVMNTFKDEEERFYLLEEHNGKFPTPLNEACNPDWLAHFSLGDLYERNEFASPLPKRN
jgi:energy-coupling factor transporter ATP-binding protein EcfA2